MVMPCDIRDSARDRTGLDRGERIFFVFSRFGRRCPCRPLYTTSCLDAGAIREQESRSGPSAVTSVAPSASLSWLLSGTVILAFSGRLAPHPDGPPAPAAGRSRRRERSCSAAAATYYLPTYVRLVLGALHLTSSPTSCELVRQGSHLSALGLPI